MVKREEIAWAVWLLVLIASSTAETTNVTEETVCFLQSKSENSKLTENAGSMLVADNTGNAKWFLVHHAAANQSKIESPKCTDPC